jgi:hypothetical protein
MKYLKTFESFESDDDGRRQADSLQGRRSWRGLGLDHSPGAGRVPDL